MVKKRKFWTPLKVIITILIIFVLLFFLLKILGVEFPFLSTSSGISETISGAGNGGGGPLT